MTRLTHVVVRIVTLTVAALIAVPVLAGQSPQPFKARTNLVVVPVVVLDKKDAVVADLTASDFTIEEDGTPVAIETFVAPSNNPGADREPRLLVIVLDNILTPPELGFRVKGIAQRFVDRMGPRDVATVIAINRGTSVTTSSKAELKAAINKFSPLSGGADGFSQQAAHGLRMITSLTEQIAEAPHPRKVMVFIGSGAVFTPSVPSSTPSLQPMMAPEWAAAVRAAARHNVSVYAINPMGPEGGFDDWALSFTTDTGGHSWSNTNNYGGAVNQIWRESGNYYVLCYVSPAADDKPRAIKVKVNQPGVKVRARRAR
jgi:VWFA-related protein